MGGVWLWRIYPRRAGGDSTAGAGRQGQAAAKRWAFRPLTARPRPCRVDGGDGGYMPPELRERYEKSPGTKCPGAVLFLPGFGIGRHIRLMAVGRLQNVIVGPIALGHIREQHQTTGMVGNILLVGLTPQ